MVAIGKCDSNDSLFVKFSNFGDKCSMNFVGLCVVVDKRFGERALTFLPSPPEHGTAALEHFRKTGKKYHLYRIKLVIQVPSTHLTGEQRPPKITFLEFR